MSDAEQGGPEAPDVTLAVIAGGRGTRLGGVAKGLLEVEGRPVLARVLDLGDLCGEVLLVAGEPHPYARFGVRTVGDVLPGRGAPGGVHAALVQAHTEWVLAVACDMPFVTRAVVRVLLGARGPDVDAVCWRVDGRAEPLLALYRRALARPWGEALASGGPSLRALLEEARTAWLPEAALRAVDPEGRAVVSVNTPEDLARHGVSIAPGGPPRGEEPPG